MTANQPEPSVEAPANAQRPWLRSRRAVPRLVMQPLERFLRLETGSAALLMAAAVAALAWSNIDADSYERFWSSAVALRIGSLRIDEDLRHLVNDLLMAIFFYVIALEVKREMLFGSLRERASAAVPVAAALGTMVGAAIVYLAINLDGGEPRGWAVPIATDIAFALGVLGLAGRRAPRELRAFLLTLAVVDDIGTIAVIALFYGGHISLAWLGAAAGLTALVVLFQRLAVRSLFPYITLAGLLWLATFESGIHPTIAGVILGFLTPAAAFYAREETGRAIATQLAEIDDSDDAEMTQRTLWDVNRLAREAVSPLARLEHQLHPWSAFLILPLFALANAGVPVSGDVLADALTGPVGLGIALGLVVGAPIGGFLFAWSLVRFSRARLPEGLDWAAIGGVAPLKGIGFTVAIFISVLAFEDRALQDQAKLAILVASATAGVIGLAVLYARARLLRRRQ